MCFATTTIPVKNFLSTLKLFKRPLKWLDFQDGDKIVQSQLKTPSLSLATNEDDSKLKDWYFS